MLTYEQAAAYLAKGRDKERRKLENNTWLEIVDTCDGKPVYGVRLHATLVVTIWPNGEYSLQTRGWNTATTKARINEYSPASLYSQGGRWFVFAYSNVAKARVAYLFFDGIRIGAGGTPLNCEPFDFAAEKRKNRIRGAQKAAITRKRKFERGLEIAARLYERNAT